MQDTRDFATLIRRAQGGSQDALNAILDHLRPELERLASGYADPRRAIESTADVVQEAWVRVWNKLDRFRGSANDAETAAMFRSWVKQIVHRVGLNVQRTWRAPTREPGGGRLVGIAGHSGAPGAEPSGNDPTPSARVSIEEEWRLVRNAIERLPDSASRQMVIGRFFEGQSLRELARRAGISYRTALRRFEAALGELERELGESIDAPSD